MGEKDSQMPPVGSRDNPGPDHQPTFQSTQIAQVILMKSPFVKYGDDNMLTELYRPEWHGVFAPDEPIEHLYTVSAPTGGMRKEWYFHEHTLDRYMLLSGTLEIGLYDAREESSTFGVFELVTLEQPGGDRPNGVRIPPRVWHSLNWKSLEGMLLNAKLPRYTSNFPDKFRIQLEDLPAVINWLV